VFFLSLRSRYLPSPCGNKQWGRLRLGGGRGCRTVFRQYNPPAEKREHGRHRREPRGGRGRGGGRGFRGTVRGSPRPGGRSRRRGRRVDRGPPGQEGRQGRRGRGGWRPQSTEALLVKKEAREGEEEEDDPPLSLSREELLEPLAVKVVPPQPTEF